MGTGERVVDRGVGVGVSGEGERSSVQIKSLWTIIMTSLIPHERVCGDAVFVRSLEILTRNTMTRK